MNDRRSSGHDKREPHLTIGSTRPRSPAEMLEPSRAPQRPSRSRIAREPRAVPSFVKVLSGLFTAAVLAISVTGGLSLYLAHQFEQPGPLETSRSIVIPKGDGLLEIAEHLESEGIISNRWTFIVGHMLQGYVGSKKRQELKAGEYEIKKSASMRQVMETLAEGKVVLMKITIAEGLTSQQVVEKLKADDNLTGDLAAVPPEGTLLPDTYRFSKGMSRQELIERMQADMQKFLAAAWEKRKLDILLTSPEQVLIFASIVERETGRADERDKVAAVFSNRLKKKMRLQSDPTIIYGIAGGAGTLGRPISKADIEGKTDYNTYQIDGLPPGPICNPGRTAIEASLNPAETTDLYFVADGTGGHTFSDTYKEHTAAVGVLRKIEKDIRTKDSQTQPVAGDPNTLPIPSNGQTRAVIRVAPPPAGTSAGTPAANPTAEESAAAAAAADISISLDPSGGDEKTEAKAPPATVPANAADVPPLPVKKPKKP